MNRATGHVYTVNRKRGPQWYVKYRLPHGRQLQKRLGPAHTGRGRPPEGHFTRRTAEEALQAILTDTRRGTLAGMTTTGATFMDAAGEWLRYVEQDRKRRPSTVRDYRNTINSRLNPEFGTEPLEAIGSDRIDAWRAELVDEGKLSARTINKMLVILHGIFKQAMRVYGLPSNPVDGVDRQPQRRSGDFEVFTPGEIRLLASKAESEEDAAIYTVAGFTGLRLGELRALRWEDIDFANRIVHVRRSFTYGDEGAPKSGRVRSVPLIDQAAQVLDNLSRREHFTDPGDLVFVTTTGGMIDDSGLRRRYYDAVKAAGLKRLTFHSLRHTFGTIAVQAFPLTDVKAYMGHADIQTTMIYVHHVPQHDAADRLSHLVDAAEDPLEESVSPTVSRTEQISGDLTGPDTA
jgi:integrase